MKIELVREEISTIIELALILHNQQTDYCCNCEDIDKEKRNICKLCKEEIFCNEAKILSDRLPERIKVLLQVFSQTGSPTGYILFADLPTNPLYSNAFDTPQDNKQNIGGKTLLACIQAILLSFMGDLIGYEAECNGSLFQDIVPIKATEGIQTSTSSKTELEIHTEQAFSDYKPDILSLACYRGDLLKEAKTYILTVDKIVDNISLDDLERLLRPLWVIGIDYSFLVNKTADIRGPLAILNGSIEDLKLVFDQDLMKGLTEDATKLIKKITDIYYLQRCSHNLQQGEILFIDNNRAVHGRSSFSPNYDGKDRFLIRCFGTFGFNKSTKVRKGRTILSKYS
jgi:L-asparagine oxygenase